MIKSMIEVVVDYTVNSGLVELGFILSLGSKLNDLTVAKDLGIIKNCHYVILRNEINFHIKECLKELERKKNENKNT